MNKNQLLKRIICFSLLIAFACPMFADSTTAEPYGKDEFPQWAKDLRRTEIISFGSLPFATLGVTLGYGIVKYLDGSSTTISNPFNKSSTTYSLEEQKTILGISCATSLALGITDLAINHITRSIKRKKMLEINKLKEIEKINVKQVTAEEAGEMLRAQNQLIIEKEKIDAERKAQFKKESELEQTDDLDALENEDESQSTEDSSTDIENQSTSAKN